MQLPVLPVPRPRLPVSLLTQTGHERKPRQKWPGGPMREKQNNRWTRSGRRRFLGKLDNLSELSGMRKDIRRIAVALEKLAGMKSEDSDEE